MIGVDELVPDINREYLVGRQIGNIKQDLVLGEISRDNFSTELLDFRAKKGGLIFCITIYNEPGIALQTTIKSLIDSIACSISSSSIQTETPVTFCIVADGINKISSTVVEFFEVFGLYLSEIGTIKKDLFYFKNEFKLDSLKECLASFMDSNSNDIDNWKEVYAQSLVTSNSHVTLNNNESKIQFLFLLKKDNAGKLDSHWWFYHVFCPMLAPDICFQIDVGTVPSRECINEMLRLMQSEKGIGAVASSIVVPEPKNIFSVLNGWQYFTFMKCMAQEWPAEVESGYLSVIPGQLSAIKWDAIAYDQQGTGPLIKYFKGLERLAPHESMLYMAEDRVLCSEIVVRKTADWKLTYSPSAVAVTDPCESWGELFRQRRRWCNSYLACRINFFHKIKESFFDKKRNFNQKLDVFMAIFYQFFLLIKDWGFPAMLFLSYQNLLQLVTNDRELSWFSHLANGLWGGVIASSVLTFLVCLRGKLDRYSGCTFIVAGLSQVIFILVCAAALIIDGIKFAPLLILSFAYVLLIGVSVWVLKGREAAGTFKLLVPNILVLTPVWFLIWTYSICNGHDTSWGTKGLHTQDNNMTGSGFLSRNAFRYGYLTLWIVSNLLVGTALLAISHVLAVNVISFIFFILVANSLYSVFSIRKIKRVVSHNF
jgi:chitin synthase